MTPTMPTEPAPPYNYYKATFRVVTACRAQRMGIYTWRAYGYYVLIDPPVYGAGRLPGTERVECWCNSKTVALKQAAYYREAQRKGTYACSCGSGKRAGVCCGVLYNVTAGTDEPTDATA